VDGAKGPFYLIVLLLMLKHRGDDEHFRGAIVMKGIQEKLARGGRQRSGTGCGRGMRGGAGGDRNAAGGLPAVFASARFPRDRSFIRRIRRNGLVA